jgi:hypothetical protein
MLEGISSFSITLTKLLYFYFQHKMGSKITILEISSNTMDSSPMRLLHTLMDSSDRLDYEKFYGYYRNSYHER